MNVLLKVYRRPCVNFFSYSIYYLSFSDKTLREAPLPIVPENLFQFQLTAFLSDANSEIYILLYLFFYTSRYYFCNFFYYYFSFPRCVYFCFYSEVASDRGRRTSAVGSPPLQRSIPHALVLIFFSMNPHCTRKVIGGELQERLIPVPYSKTSTDQAVRFHKKPALSLTI